jgi:hypothetical protein
MIVFGQRQLNAIPHSLNSAAIPKVNIGTLFSDLLAHKERFLDLPPKSLRT